MKSSLTHGMDKDTEEEFKRAWDSSLRVRNRLKDHLTKRKEDLIKQLISRELVTGPGDYAIKQASISAEIRKLEEFCNLLS